MINNVLDVRVGRVARERIAEHGWEPSLFSLMLGASGGPKWLVLSQLDRVLSERFLSRRETPLHILGTSIGSWRHAALAQKDPLGAITRMEEHYIHQTYTQKPSVHEVSEVSRGIMQQILQEEGVQHILNHPTFITHIGTVRGRGLVASQNLTIHGMGLALVALSNFVSRRWTEPWYQRVMFSGNEDGQGTGMVYEDFDTVYAPLREENVFDALMASASIPLTLEGVRDLAFAPPGQYWDGGIIDYHHDLRAYKGEGLVLYPHFYPYIIPGWLDKSLKGRRAKGKMLDQVVLISPSEAFVETLPNQKVPDRKDFSLMGNDERIKAWWEVTRRCEALAEALQELLTQDDPLHGVASLE